MKIAVAGTTVTAYKCLVCLDTGTQIYKEPAPANVYGPDAGFDVTYARPCPNCGGTSAKYEDTTGIPEQFSDASFSKFNFEAYKDKAQAEKIRKLVDSMVSNFKPWEQRGKGLYLWSTTPGSGKTYLACSVARSIALMRRDLRVKFVTVPKYLELVAEGSKQERGLIDPSAIFRECEVLVLDDIGAQKDSKSGWEREKLFELINSRSCLVTIFTSNMDIGDLNIDDRTKSRVMTQGIQIHMPEQSIRDEKALDDNDEFIKTVMR